MRTLRTQVLLLLLAPAASAFDTIEVPGDHPNVQDAIDAALPGDTVLVSAGVYREQLDFGGKEIAVTSVDGPATTVIDGQGSGPVVRFAASEGSGTLFEGFTVTGGQIPGFSGFGAGIQVIGASPTIRGNVVELNSADGGGGIGVDDGSPRIEDNHVRANVAGDSFGGAVSLRGDCSALVVGNWIEGNSTGGVVIATSGVPVLRGNTIENNTTGYEGGGVYVYFSSPVIEENVIRGNQVGGVRLQGAGQAQVIGNLIEDNRFGNFGVGISCWSAGNALIRGNVLRGNRDGRGAGIGLVNSNLNVVIENNLISNNEASQGGGIYYSNMAITRHNTIVDNVATTPNGGGAIYYSGGSLAELSHNILAVAGSQNAFDCSSFAATPPMTFNAFWAPGGAAFGPNCTDMVGVDGNLSADPSFRDPEGLDYRLSPGSPLIDAGDSALNTGLDLGGVPRFLDGDLDGVALRDQGAHEYSNVYLDLTAGAASGDLVAEVSGTRGLFGIVIAGTAARTPTYRSPYGALYLDLSRDFVILAAGPLPLKANVDANLARPGLTVQAFTRRPQPVVSGNTSNPWFAE